MKLYIISPLRFRWRWWIMFIAKRTGGWDIWLGNRFGWDYDDDRGSFLKKPHWHINIPPYVVYRNEY